MRTCGAQTVSIDPREEGRRADLIERLGEELGTAAMCNIAVPGVIPEELGLRLELLVHRLARVDILLTAVDDPDESQLERVHSPGEDVESIRTRIHEIELGENSDRAATLRVDLSSELERLRVGQIDVGRGDGKDDTRE